MQLLKKKYRNCKVAINKTRQFRKESSTCEKKRKKKDYKKNEQTRQLTTNKRKRPSKNGKKEEIVRPRKRKTDKKERKWGNEQTGFGKKVENKNHAHIGNSVDEGKGKE